MPKGLAIGRTLAIHRVSNGGASIGQSAALRAAFVRMHVSKGASRGLRWGQALVGESRRTYRCDRARVDAWQKPVAVRVETFGSTLCTFAVLHRVEPNQIDLAAVKKFSRGQASVGESTRTPGSHRARVDAM